MRGAQAELQRAKVVTFTVASGAVARNDRRASTFLLCEIACGRSDGEIGRQLRSQIVTSVRNVEQVLGTLAKLIVRNKVH